jgi:hypothetical protein
MTLATDGLVLPVTHGTPRSFALGNLHDAPLPELAARWPNFHSLRSRGGRFRRLRGCKLLILGEAVSPIHGNSDETRVF